MSRSSFKLWGLSSTIRINSFATEHRQREGERRSRAQLALHPDPAAVQLHEPPAQRSPEHCALHILRRRPHLAELLKNRLLVLLGDADAGVADGDRDQLVLWRGLDLDPPTLQRDLDGVA